MTRRLSDRDGRVPLPDRIKDAREVLGWTREILAAYSGVSVSTIGRIERGEMKPRAGSIIALAIALGIPVEELAAEAGMNLRIPPEDRA
jgi:transcriptional regulator with XRE-family HTH domain